MSIISLVLSVTSIILVIKVMKEVTEIYELLYGIDEEQNNTMMIGGKNGSRQKSRR